MTREIEIAAVLIATALTVLVLAMSRDRYTGKGFIGSLKDDLSGVPWLLRPIVIIAWVYGLLLFIGVMTNALWLVLPIVLLGILGRVHETIAGMLKRYTSDRLAHQEKPRKEE